MTTTHGILLPFFQQYQEWRVECTCGWVGSYHRSQRKAEQEYAAHVRTAGMVAAHALTLAEDDRTADKRGWPWAVVHYRWICSCGKEGTWKGNRGDAVRGHTQHARKAVAA